LKNDLSYGKLGGTIGLNRGKGLLDTVGLMLGILFLLILIEPTISAIAFTSFAVIDEATLLLVYVMIMYRIISRGTIGKIEILALSWVTYCLMISIAFGVNRSAMDILLQGFSQSKLIFFSIGAILFLSDRVSAQVMRWSIYLVIFGGILSVLLPGIFLAISETERLRGSGLFGLPPALGFQLSTNRLGRMLAALPLLTAAQIGVSRRRFQVIFALSLFLILMSDGRIAVLLFMGLSAARFYLLIRSKGKRLLALLSLCAPAATAVAFLGYYALRIDNLGSGDLTGEDAPIYRIILLIDGLTLARDHFPIGAGLATFGTPLSLDQNIYATLLTGQTFFFLRGTVFDNNYASIIGETGLLGSLILFWTLLTLLTVTLKSAHSFAYVGAILYLLIILAFESALQVGSTSVFFALVLRAVARGQWRLDS